MSNCKQECFNDLQVLVCSRTKERCIFEQDGFPKSDCHYFVEDYTRGCPRVKVD